MAFFNFVSSIEILKIEKVERHRLPFILLTLTHDMVVLVYCRIFR